MSPRPLRSARRRGFTLVELLTVIAIIAVLMAILLPVFAGIRANARKTNCMSNLHQIIQGLKMYKDDWRVYPDALYGAAYGPSNQISFRLGGPVPGLTGSNIREYIKDPKAFNCPNSTYRLNNVNLVSVINPMTGQPPMDRFGREMRFAEFDSYDWQSIPNEPNAARRELHYNLKWTTAGAGIGDNPRQLLYREPPDSTVVTWCLYHSDMGPNGIPPTGQTVVAFLSGRVQSIAYNQLPPWPDQPGGQPEHGPWEVNPKP